MLAPAGDFECLKAAVQNGADAVYFGASSFSARSFATNFDDSTLESAINSNDEGQLQLVEDINECIDIGAEVTKSFVIDLSGYDQLKSI